ncbi:MAG TPA: hypothetical protein VLM85_02575 [Polyangiaceae bacterium]|nr:hypothetical protein [Polyangiaceae bacterium]
MHYLYGDSAPSPLTSNFLEFLRDAIDFAVFVLQADERIEAGKVKSAALRAVAEEELAALDRFASAMSTAIDGAEQGPAGSPAAQCAARLAHLLGSTRGAVADAVRNKLAADIAAIDADEAAARAACVDALGVLLGPHTPPGTTTTLRLVLGADGAYDAHVAGDSSFGLDWVFELAVPPESPWASTLRLEQVMSNLEIRAPLVTGWITKEVKVRPQHLDRYLVKELTGTDGAVILELRTEPGVETGFDLEADLDAGTLAMTRVGPSDDASIGPFEVHPDDLPVLLDVARKLFDSAAELERGRLVEATLGDGTFGALATFVPFVERLVGTLAPITREIAKRSLTPTELVLRRALADDRREELFVTKASLREKLLPLAAPQRAFFAPLALDVESPSAQKSPPLPAPPGPPRIPVPPRAEVQPSRPKLPAPRPTAASPPRPTAASPPRPPPPPPPPRASSEPTLEIIHDADSQRRNEPFVEAVKRIVLVLRSGRTDEGYRQYAELISSASFTEYRPEDQRQALKLLLMAKAPEARSEAVESAYVAALARIQALVDALAEPTDYEMLGVAHLQLGDKKAAGAAFDTALKLERARDPSSELCASLSRRVGQLSTFN